MTVQLTLPDSAINADTSKTRTYEVLRVHEGVVSVIPVTFDADAKTLTFETDRFSAYAIAYKDTAATTPDDEDPGDNGSNSTTPGNEDVYKRQRLFRSSLRKARRPTQSSISRSRIWTFRFVLTTA